MTDPREIHANELKAKTKSIMSGFADVTSAFRNEQHPLSKANPKSEHITGRAIDVGFNGQSRDAYIKRMSDAGLVEGKDYTLLYEVGSGRSKHATGDHIHITYLDNKNNKNAGKLGNNSSGVPTMNDLWSMVGKNKRPEFNWEEAAMKRRELLPKEDQYVPTDMRGNAFNTNLKSMGSNRNIVQEGFNWLGDRVEEVKMGVGGYINTQIEDSKKIQELVKRQQASGYSKGLNVLDYATPEEKAFVDRKNQEAKDNLVTTAKIGTGIAATVAAATATGGGSLLVQAGALAGIGAVNVGVDTGIDALAGKKVTGELVKENVYGAALNLTGGGLLSGGAKVLGRTANPWIRGGIKALTGAGEVGEGLGTQIVNNIVSQNIQSEVVSNVVRGRGQSSEEFLSNTAMGIGIPLGMQALGSLANKIAAKDFDIPVSETNPQTISPANILSADDNVFHFGRATAGQEALKAAPEIALMTPETLNKTYTQSLIERTSLAISQDKTLASMVSGVDKIRTDLANSSERLKALAPDSKAYEAELKNNEKLMLANDKGLSKLSKTYSEVYGLPPESHEVMFTKQKEILKALDEGSLKPEELQTRMSEARKVNDMLKYVIDGNESTAKLMASERANNQNELFNSNPISSTAFEIKPENIDRFKQTLVQNPQLATPELKEILVQAKGLEGLTKTNNEFFKKVIGGQDPEANQFANRSWAELDNFKTWITKELKQAQKSSSPKAPNKIARLTEQLKMVTGIDKLVRNDFKPMVVKSSDVPVLRENFGDVAIIKELGNNTAEFSWKGYNPEAKTLQSKPSPLDSAKNRLDVPLLNSQHKYTYTPTGNNIVDSINEYDFKNAKEINEAMEVFDKHGRDPSRVFIQDTVADTSLSKEITKSLSDLNRLTNLANNDPKKVGNLEKFKNAMATKYGLDPSGDIEAQLHQQKQNLDDHVAITELNNAFYKATALKVDTDFNLIMEGANHKAVKSFFGIERNCKDYMNDLWAVQHPDSVDPITGTFIDFEDHYQINEDFYNESRNAVEYAIKIKRENFSLNNPKHREAMATAMAYNDTITTIGKLQDAAIRSGEKINPIALQQKMFATFKDNLATLMSDPTLITKKLNKQKKTFKEYLENARSSPNHVFFKAFSNVMENLDFHVANSDLSAFDKYIHKVLKTFGENRYLSNRTEANFMKPALAYMNEIGLKKVENNMGAAAKAGVTATHIVQQSVLTSTPINAMQSYMEGIGNVKATSLELASELSVDARSDLKPAIKNYLESLGYGHNPENIKEQLKSAILFTNINAKELRTPYKAHSLTKLSKYDYGDVVTKVGNFIMAIQDSLNGIPFRIAKAGLDNEIAMHAAILAQGTFEKGGHSDMGTFADIFRVYHAKLKAKSLNGSRAFVASALVGNNVFAKAIDLPTWSATIDSTLTKVEDKLASFDNPVATSIKELVSLPTRMAEKSIFQFSGFISESAAKQFKYLGDTANNLRNNRISIDEGVNELKRAAAFIGIFGASGTVVGGFLSSALGVWSSIRGENPDENKVKESIDNFNAYSILAGDKYLNTYKLALSPTDNISMVLNNTVQVSQIPYQLLNNDFKSTGILAARIRDYAKVGEKFSALFDKNIPDNKKAADFIESVATAFYKGNMSNLRAGIAMSKGYQKIASTQSIYDFVNNPSTSINYSQEEWNKLEADRAYKLYKYGALMLGGLRNDDVVAEGTKYQSYTARALKRGDIVNTLTEFNQEFANQSKLE